MSISWPSDVSPSPALLVLPPDAASLDEANAAIELWEHYSGKTLDPSQRLVVFVIMAETADGRWAAATTGREMPRQNGKGDEIEVVELWGLVQRAEAILHTVHDAVLLASQAQQRMLAVLDKPDLRRLVKRKWLGTGQQMIEMRNGGIVWYRTRTGGGGRGVDDVSRLVVDEAQHATEEQLAAVTPTLLANANPQMNVMGTSAIAGRSDWWWSVRLRALGADPGAFGYVGHTAERVSLNERGEVVQLPVDVDDRALWSASNPAVASGRGQGMTFLEEQLKRMGPDSFAREHLGVWDPPPGDAHRGHKIPAAEWAATVHKDARPQGRVSFAYDVDIDGQSASISVASGSISAPYVETVEHRQRVGWLADRLVELVQAHDPISVGYNAAGPALEQLGSVSVAFRAAGLSTDILTPLGQAEYRAACGGFWSDVVEGRLRRPPNQLPLDLAGEDASDRPLGEGWVWDRRQATVPISPLVSATVARALLPVEVEPESQIFAF